MKKCFVTGGAGLIGLHTCIELKKKGHDVSIYDLGEQIDRHKDKIPLGIKVYHGSILDFYTLQNAMKGSQYVFHLAAMLGVKYTEDLKLDCLEVNCSGTKNVLQAAVSNKIKKVIFASSSEIYGEPDLNPITEKFMPKGKTLYGISKILGEEYCKSYYQKYKLNYTILRYFNTYGPLQQNKFVITKFINSAKKGKKVLINGDGKQIRSYMYVSDAARGTVIAGLSSKTNQKTYNVGNGNEPISLIDLANLIGKILKKKLKISFSKNFKGADRKKEREIFERYCNSNKIFKTIKWKPKINVKRGIKHILKYNYNAK